ncbi:MAG: DASH family cryptochrome [Planctomycetota bacterium]
MPTAAVWFRSDLRVHDHLALEAAAKSGLGHLACIYVVDPRAFADSRELGQPRCGAHRASFLGQSVEALRERLRAMGSDLLVVVGEPEEVLPQLANEHEIAELHFHRRVGSEEQAIEAHLEAALQQAGVKTLAHWDWTLVDPETLPFAAADTPATFSSFRRKAERVVASSGFPAPVAAPERLPPPPSGLLQSASAADLMPWSGTDAAGGLAGGEQAGLDRVQRWVWQRDALRSYKETRNGMVGDDYASRFSPWLAHGCLSPRFVQSEVERYERERVRNASTGWLTVELLWRDYFQFVSLQNGSSVFASSGLRGVPVPWRPDDKFARAQFDAWCEGRTGYPIVDANMRELAATGFLSNRGRQIVASFLTKNLGLDWRWGAEWFERQLVDYDVGSNWGNWNYAAGVGNDARGFRYFDLANQARKYDADGEHARLWCPEISKLPDDLVHAPHELSREQQARYGCTLGADYPAPIIDLAASVRTNRERWEAAMARAR